MTNEDFMELGLTVENLNDTGIDNLRNAIVLQAVDDYRDPFFKSRNNEEEQNFNDAIEFFKSQYANFISICDPMYIFGKLTKELNDLATEVDRLIFTDEGNEELKQHVIDYDNQDVGRKKPRFRKARLNKPRCYIRRCKLITGEEIVIGYRLAKDKLDYTGTEAFNKSKLIHKSSYPIEVLADDFNKIIIKQSSSSDKPFGSRTYAIKRTHV